MTTPDDVEAARKMVEEQWIEDSKKKDSDDD